MNAAERDRMATLRRRRNHLCDRVADRRSRRDSAELAALDWALRVIEAADQQGVLDTLARRNHSLL